MRLLHDCWLFGCGWGQWIGCGYRFGGRLSTTARQTVYVCQWRLEGFYVHDLLYLQTPFGFNVFFVFIIYRHGQMCISTIKRHMLASCYLWLPH